MSGTRNVFAERTGGGFFLDIEWNRDALARYRLSIEAAQSVVQNAIGGENVTTLARVLVMASDGQRQIRIAREFRHPGRCHGCGIASEQLVTLTIECEQRWGRFAAAEPHLVNHRTAPDTAGFRLLPIGLVRFSSNAETM